MAEVWVPDGSLSVTQTYYSNGTSAVVVNGTFVRRDLDRSSPGFPVPTMEEIGKAVGPPPPPRPADPTFL